MGKEKSSVMKIKGRMSNKSYQFTRSLFPKCMGFSSIPTIKKETDLKCPTIFDIPKTNEFPYEGSYCKPKEVIRRELESEDLQKFLNTDDKPKFMYSKISGDQAADELPLDPKYKNCTVLSGIVVPPPKLVKEKGEVYRGRSVKCLLPFVIIYNPENEIVTSKMFEIVENEFQDSFKNGISGFPNLIFILANASDKHFLDAQFGITSTWCIKCKQESKIQCNFDDEHCEIPEDQFRTLEELEENGKILDCNYERISKERLERKEKKKRREIEEKHKKMSGEEMKDFDVEVECKLTHEEKKTIR